MYENLCGKCVHWHEWEKQKFHLRQGHCDKIAIGTKFGDKMQYEFDDTSFEDECYDDEFHCFEQLKEQKE